MAAETPIAEPLAESAAAWVLDPGALDALIEALRSDGYAVVGPTVRDGAIVYDRVDSAGELPRGWGDRQEPGRYRLERWGDETLFGYAVGPHSWKHFLFPAHERLREASRDGDAVTVEAPPPEATRHAFLGARACELRAIAMQDRVFTGGFYVDAGYARRSEGAFLIAVECAVAGGTCFCASMDAGPGVEDGFDVALTELTPPAGEGREAGATHELLARAGSERGSALLARLPRREATAADRERARAVVKATTVSLGRSLDTKGIRELLRAAAEHPRWDDVAARCLSCTNWTLVCPTCFCSSVSDTSDLTGAHVERTRRWDSCFSLDFSAFAGGHVRGSTRSRYRQWLTHKLASWIDQFGSSGRVSCGRCITWCPVGIDITHEAAAIRAAPMPVRAAPPAGARRGARGEEGAP